MKILMVCLGNICRSPLAEGILKNKTKNIENIKVDSAGIAGYHIGNSPDTRAIQIANEYNINITQQVARQFCKNDFSKYDIIYAMDKSNYSHLVSLAQTKEHRNKIKMILNEVRPGSYESVPDPYYGGDKGFENVFKLLEIACEEITKKIG